MKRTVLFIFTMWFIIVTGRAQEITGKHASGHAEPVMDSVLRDIVLEPCTYTDNFEDGDLGAWASYPLWQDNAYDQNFQVGEIVPGDTNISIVQKVTPYSNVDNYAGAQKLLDMYLLPGAKLSFRYYLKTNQPVEFLKVRLAAGKYGKIDVTLPAPGRNKWVEATINFNDFVRENPAIAGKTKVRIYALAFLAKIPDADPAMPIYIGLDDITFKAAQATAFRFAEPTVYKLPEFSPYIPKKHYQEGDLFHLSGRWPVGANKVSLEIASYTDQKKTVFRGNLTPKGDLWALKPVNLSFPDGLYLGRLVAYKDEVELSETEFTLHIAPGNMAGKHPRLLFDEGKKKQMDGLFRKERFLPVYDTILSKANAEREEIPVKSLAYDLDQFPDEDWLPSWTAFGSHIFNTGDALRWNALAYAFHRDTVAGEYVKNLLITLAGWPTWESPWLIKRKRFSDHRMGTWSHSVALAYDLTYNLMTPDERTQIRRAILEKIVEGAHRTYVYDNNVTSNTSNWIAHVMGGSLMCMAAIYGDGPETENMEPYFTGAMMKFYSFITHVTDSKDGAWGEGLGYNDYSFSNLSYSVPSIKNVFNIDVTAPLAGTYNEYIWGGLIKDKKWFGFGDSNDTIGAATNWAFLLSMRKEPRLSWYYNYLKKGETFDDVLFDTRDTPQDSPFNENPDKVFHRIGTTVFKSGWGKDDFVFVMRTGAFFNHQHLDQGSFQLADRGITFIEDQPIHNSDYYNDPLYQSRFIQPVAHSTILINGNDQSQRVGDPLNFAPGFNDHAFIRQFLDGKNAAFSSGDIGRLYWNKIKSLTRNVLYIKPGTVLMLDVVVPGEKDAGVTLLYQTARLKDIQAGQHISTITKDGVTLNIMHLAPGSVEAKAVETPHYLNTLLKDKPLLKEGMLTITARTNHSPLVMANLLTTTTAGTAPDVTSESRNGFITGTASGEKFAFTTKPGNVYHVADMETDALAMTWDDANSFIAMATVFRRKGRVILASDDPVTFEHSADSIKYYRNTKGKLMIGVAAKPSAIILNGQAVNAFTYDEQRKLAGIEVPGGQGTIVIKR